VSSREVGRDGVGRVVTDDGSSRRPIVVPRKGRSAGMGAARARGPPGLAATPGLVVTWSVELRDSCAQGAGRLAARRVLGDEMLHHKP
jgi:hypothetical protein